LNSDVVLFERVTVRDGSPTAVTGIGFLSSLASKSASPFSLSVSSPGPLGFAPWIGFAQLSSINFSGMGDSFWEFSNHGGASGALSAHSLSSFAAQNLMDLSQSPLSVIVSKDGSKAAWIDADLHVYVSSLGAAQGQENSAVNSIAMGDCSPKQLKMSSQGEYLVVEGENKNHQPESVLVSLSTPQAQVLAIYPGLGMSLNPGLTQLAYFSSPSTLGKTSVMINGVIFPASNSKNYLTDSDHLSNLSWADDSHLSFVSTDQKSAIHFLSLSDGSVSKIADLDLPSSLVGRTACLSWHAGGLYFGEVIASGFVISRVEPSSKGVWNKSVFATSRDDNDGFICPQTINSVEPSPAPTGGPSS
jgi:hypothetical protein